MRGIGAFFSGLLVSLGCLMGMVGRFGREGRKGEKEREERGREEKGLTTCAFSLLLL